MVTDTGALLQSRFTSLIDRIGMQTTIYRPVSVALPDGNLVPDAVVQAGTSMASIQMGKSAEAQAGALGIFGAQVAMVAFPAAAEANLALGNVITDAKGRCWLIRSEGTIPEWSVTSIVSVWLVSRVQQNAIPEGVTL